MCYFITCVARVRDAVRLARLAHDCCLGWEPIENPAVARLLLPGETYYSTTQSICDCGTPLGAARRVDVDARQRKIDAEASRRSRQGWSTAKVQRWKAQQADNLEKTLQETDRRNHGASAGVQNWIDFLTAGLTTGLADSLGLLLHFYRLDVVRERDPVHSRQSLPLSELTNERLARLDEDTLMVFVLDDSSTASPATAG